MSSAKKTTTPENKPTTTPTADEKKSPIDTEEIASMLKDFQVRAPTRVAQYLSQGNVEDARWLDRARACDCGSDFTAITSAAPRLVPCRYRVKAAWF